MNPPLVSVVLTTYNGEHFVKDTLSMLKAQTYPHFECLVVDDGSRDLTQELYRTAAKGDRRIKVLDYIPRRNVGFAREWGIRKAQGEFIAILDQDDLWHPEKLARQMQVMQEHPELDMTFTTHACFEHGQHPLSWPKLRDGIKLDSNLLPRLLRGNFVACDAIMVRKDSEHRIKGFVGSLDLYHCEDYASILKYALNGKIGQLNATLTLCRTHNQSKSRANPLRLARHLDTLARYFLRKGHTVVARHLFAQAQKTTARSYWPQRPHRALPHMWQSFKLAPRPRTALILGLCALLSLPLFKRRKTRCAS